MTKEIYLSLGSNLGDRAKHLEEAVRLVSLRVGPPGKISGIYESESWGYYSEHRFCNCCLSVLTDLQPLPVLEAILQIEREMGRDRSSSGENEKGYTDRIIDIDLLLFGDMIYDHPRLRIPHPAMTDRRFIMLPMHEIAPSVVHPVLGLPMEQLLEQCPDRGKVWPYGQHKP